MPEAVFALVQEKRRRDLALQNFQLAVTAGLPHLAGNQLGLPSPGSCPVRPQLPGVSSSNMLMEGFPHSLLQSGTHFSSVGCACVPCMRRPLMCRPLSHCYMPHQRPADALTRALCDTELSIAALIPYPGCL